MAGIFAFRSALFASFSLADPCSNGKDQARREEFQSPDQHESRKRSGVYDRIVVDIVNYNDDNENAKQYERNSIQDTRDVRFVHMNSSNLILFKSVYSTNSMGKHYVSKQRIINDLATDKVFENTQKSEWDERIIQFFTENK